MQCEEAYDQHDIGWFFLKVAANGYFIWIISSFEKSTRGAAVADGVAAVAAGADQSPA